MFTPRKRVQVFLLSIFHIPFHPLTSMKQVGISPVFCLMVSIAYVLLVLYLLLQHLVSQFFVVMDQAVREQYSTLIRHLCVWTSLCACTHTVGFFQFCSQFKVPFYSLLVVWRKHTGKYEDKKIFLWAPLTPCFVMFSSTLWYTHIIL